MIFLTIAWNEIKRTIRRRSVVLVLFVMPLLLIFILGTALSDMFTIKDKNVKAVHVGIVNLDNGQMSASFNQFLKQPSTREYVRAEKVASRKELVSKLRKSEVAYGVVIPKGFTEAALSGQKTEWEYISGTSRDKNYVAESMLQNFLDNINGLQSAATVLGPSAAAQQEMGQQKQGSGETNVVFGSLNRKNLETTAIQYYAAQMLIMFLMFAAMIGGVMLALDKENHTLARIMSAPVKAERVMLAKLCGYGFFSFGQALAIIAVTHWGFGVYWGDRIGWLLLICLLTIVSSMSIAVILLSMVKSHKRVDSAYSMMIFIMTFISGGMIPNLGGMLHHIGEFTVNHWASRSIIRIMLDSESSAVAHNVSMLGLVCAICLAGALASYRRGGYHE